MLNDAQIALRLVMATILSGAIGFEREFHGRAAGFRTHILLCVGSTLVMLTSLHVFEAYRGVTQCDPARIAAGVVTGIGFLGAGTILRSKESIRGLTTAASLWVVSGIGLAVGSGLFMGAFVTTIIALVVLFFFSRLEYSLVRKDWYKVLAVETACGIEELGRVKAVLADFGTEMRNFEVERSKDGALMVLKLTLKLSTSLHDEDIVTDIGKIDGVKSVRWERAEQ